MYKLSIIIILFFVNACAIQYAKDSPFFSEPRKNQPHAELIYQGSGLSKDIFAEMINGKLANESGKWSGLKWRVPPGIVRLYVRAGVSSRTAAYDHIEMKVEEGKSYYIYRTIMGDKVEIYVMKENTEKVYSSIVLAEKRRPPKYSAIPIIL